MAELALVKSAGGLLLPLSANDEEMIREKVKLGEVIKCEFKRSRNPKFHRKFFALLNLGFEYFEPQPVEYRGQQVTPEKNFDEFRKWVTVQAGYFEIVGYPDGTVRLRAKSISFANMEDIEFGELYQKVITVLMSNALSIFKTPEEVEHAVNQLLNGFA
ncbi:DUF1367 family protein [Shewanella sp. 202IG2-18]|uniref:DUF1367 family protein n=1 Tax=Parashewanella hymeniacidonis TaxID=2807618 RepID=UPI0019606AC7|nr:DUF1367 family protein [Parashewanella hymeniacidonis]MBM7070894.1 DUF1367 family protein [Parashewanella hymeniacidonis]